MERREPSEHSPPVEKPDADRRAAEREARLAAALRANLRRRKAQSRARQDEPAIAPGGVPSARADDGDRT